MQNVDYSSTASNDEKRKGRARERERGGERERGSCIAAKKEEFVIGREWFQMLEQGIETP